MHIPKKSALWLWLAVPAFFFFLVPVQAEDADKKTAMVGVRQYMDNLDKYSGQMTVEGVVSKIFPDDHIVALIDLAEFKQCKIVTCAMLTLPVRWTGSFPKIKETVRVTGQPKEEGGQRFFVADKTEKVESEVENKKEMDHGRP